MKSLWGILYADNAEVVSHFPEQQRKMVGVIVIVCAVFGLTVQEANIEIMCLHTKKMPKPFAVYLQLNERVCIPWGERQSQCRPVYRGQLAHTQRMMSLPEVYPLTVRPTERSHRAQNPDAQTRGTRDIAVRLRNVGTTRVLLRDATPSPPQLLDLLHRFAKKHSCVSVTRRIILTEFEARMVATELPKCATVRGRGLREGPGKRVDGVFPGRPHNFRYQR